MINLNPPDSERNAMLITGASIMACLLCLFYFDNNSSTGTVDTQKISSLLDTTCAVVDAEQSQDHALSNEEKAIANILVEKCKTTKMH